MALRNHINRSTLTIGALLVASMGYFSHAALSRVWQRPSHPVEEVGTAFTYQGQLADEGTPVTGTADLTFSLWDAAVEGNQIGPTQNFFDVPVDRGLFSVELDFGDDAFDEGARWTQIQARTPAGSGDYELLDPRQRVNPVPYAMVAPGGATTIGSVPHFNLGLGESNVYEVSVPFSGTILITGSGVHAGNSQTNNFGIVGFEWDDSGYGTAYGSVNTNTGRGGWMCSIAIPTTAGLHQLRITNETAFLWAQGRVHLLLIPSEMGVMQVD